MKKVIKVSIPEPCHENWDKMTQTEKGKFCGVCTKEVVDFTKAIDEDIVKYVMKHDNTCGRFSKTQLDRSLTLERSAGQRLAPLAASLLLPLTMMAGSMAAPKQGGVKTSTYTSLGIGSMHKAADRIQITVEGTITDVQGNPLHNVKIEVKETGKTAFTDKKGNYSITFLDKETLIFTQDGFELSQHTFGNYNETFDTQLTQKIAMPQIMGNMVAPKIIIEEEEIVKGDIAEIEDNIVKITGTISDAGLPLPGVNIIIEGTSMGTQSDFDGNYTIEAPENSILVVSYIGFDTEEIQLSNIDNTINISMLGSDYDLMGEMIIVGLIATDPKDSFYPFGNFGETYLDPEREAERAAHRKAAANGLAFKKMKLAKKKEARQLKRAQKK